MGGRAGGLAGDLCHDFCDHSWRHMGLVSEREGELCYGNERKGQGAALGPGGKRWGDSAQKFAEVQDRV